MLILPIKRKWYNKIMYGDKREEYRELKPYYEKRFKTIGLLDENGLPTGNEVAIYLRNGYGNDKPTLLAWVTLSIGTGCTEWGAVEGEQYYILKIHGFDEHDDYEGF